MNLWCTINKQSIILRIFPAWVARPETFWYGSFLNCVRLPVATLRCHWLHCLGVKVCFLGCHAKRICRTCIAQFLVVKSTYVIDSLRNCLFRKKHLKHCGGNSLATICDRGPGERCHYEEKISELVHNKNTDVMSFQCACLFACRIIWFLYCAMMIRITWHYSNTESRI